LMMFFSRDVGGGSSRWRICRWQCMSRGVVLRSLFVERRAWSVGVGRGCSSFFASGVLFAQIFLLAYWGGTACGVLCRLASLQAMSFVHSAPLAGTGRDPGQYLSLLLFSCHDHARKIPTTRASRTRGTDNSGLRILSRGYS
jgi:hypothetical protein